jgi:carbamoyl-phosphate synthase small subunit
MDRYNTFVGRVDINTYINDLKNEYNSMLILEDGTILSGKGFGYANNTSSLGEVVFNTSMTGYQEVLTDPSNCGQIVVMTYPLIGNYGLNAEDLESVSTRISGLVVKEVCDVPSNWRSIENIDTFLKVNRIMGISGIDTRLLTRKIRAYGTLKGIITTETNPDIQSIIKKLKETDEITNQVSQVSTKNIFRSPGSGHRVVLIDLGAKEGIQRELIRRNCDVTIVPYNTTYDQIKRLQPDGIMISNGPGNPKNVLETSETIKQFIGKIPMYGICLGHQIIALSAGADTEKLKFGHRGGNNPVKDVRNNRVYITSQNHGYTVKKDSLAGTNLEISHINLNDNTIEGLVHSSGILASVQYHPEAAPGPYDSNYLFDEFIDTITKWKLSTGSDI